MSSKSALGRMGASGSGSGSGSADGMPPDSSTGFSRGAWLVLLSPACMQSVLGAGGLRGVLHERDAGLLRDLTGALG